MEALVVGGHGFAGSRLVEKYVQEGFSVTVLDQKGDDYQRIPRVKHKFHPIDFYDWNTHRFVEHKKFDVAAVMIDPYRLTGGRDRILVFLHTLEKVFHAVGGAGARKLVLLSSCGLYSREAPVLTEGTPVAVHSDSGYFYYMAEQVCESVAQLYGLEYVILRTAELYGEEQNLSEGEIPHLLKSRRRPIVMNHGQEFACLYIDDFVEAAYKASIYSNPPVINLAADELWHFEDLRELLWYDPVQEKKLEPCPQIDNSLAKRCLDWTPLYGFEKGFDRLYSWYKKHREDKRAEEEKQASFRFRPAKAVVNTLENLLLFGVCVFLTFSSSSVVSSLSIDFNLLYIIVVGAFFGIRQSMFASILASGLLLGQRLLSGATPGMVMTDLNSMVMILTYLSVAIGLGYVIESSKEKISQLHRSLDAREQDYQTLNTLYTDNIQTLHRLEEKIMLFENSSNRLVDAFLKLETLTSSELSLNVVRAVADALDAEWVALYFVAKNKGFLRLGASSNEEYHILRNSVDLAEYPKIGKMLRTGQMLVNARMDPSQPSMMAPLSVDGECAAVLMADLGSFTDHTQYKINLFKVLVRMAGSSLANAYEYESKIINEKYIPDTNIVTESYFTKELGVLTAAGKENTRHFTVLRILPDESRKEAAQQVFRLTRDEDVLGEYQGSLCLILNHTSERQSAIVQQRLKRSGIASEVVRSLG